jgi:hypothetical protein
MHHSLMQIAGSAICFGSGAAIFVVNGSGVSFAIFAFAVLDTLLILGVP